MENLTAPNPEEMQKLLEKAQRDLEEALAEMTPEERAQAEAKAKKLIEEDKASMQELLDRGASIAAGIPPKAGTAPNFCPNCGAPAGTGKFCSNCGNLLRP